MADLSSDEVLVTKLANVVLDLDSYLDLASITQRAPWVGGKLSLLPRQLMFVPHRVEAAMLSTNAIKDFGIDLASVTSISVESRLGVKTIVVKLKDSGPTVGIRCRGAKQFAETLRSLVTQLRGRDDASHV